MPEQEQIAAAQTADREEADTLQVDDSAVTTDLNQPTPEEISGPDTGDQEAPADPDEPAGLDGEPPSDPDADPADDPDDPGGTQEGDDGRKKRTDKRVHKLLRDRREAEERARQESAQNENLKLQLQQLLQQGTGAQAEPQQESQAGSPDLAGQQAGRDQDTPEHWANLWRSTEDQNLRDHYAARYEQSKERVLVDKAVQRLKAEQQAQQQAAFLSGELARINGIVPMFKQQNGQSVLDSDSQGYQAAVNKAAQAGQRISNWAELAYWGNVAALDAVQAGGMQASVQARQTQAKLTDAQVRAQLETTTRGAPPTPGPGNFKSEYAKLKKLADAGNEAAQQQLTAIQLNRLV